MALYLIFGLVLIALIVLVVVWFYLKKKKEKAAAAEADAADPGGAGDRGDRFSGSRGGAPPGRLQAGRSPRQPARLFPGRRHRQHQDQRHGQRRARTRIARRPGLSRQQPGAHANRQPLVLAAHHLRRSRRQTAHRTRQVGPPDSQTPAPRRSGQPGRPGAARGSGLLRFRKLHQAGRPGERHRRRAQSARPPRRDVPGLRHQSAGLCALHQNGPPAVLHRVRPQPHQGGSHPGAWAPPSRCAMCAPAASTAKSRRRA